MDFSDEFSKFLDPTNIKYEDGDEGRWYLEWTLRIPSMEFKGMDFSEVETMLVKQLRYSSHGVEGNPGGRFSKCHVAAVKKVKDQYIVRMSANGGWDI